MHLFQITVMLVNNQKYRNKEVCATSNSDQTKKEDFC